MNETALTGSRVPDVASERLSASPAPDRPDLRSDLKLRTALVHQTLDDRLDALPLETEDGYVAFLSVIATALPPLERHLERHGIARLLPDWPERARRDAVMRDLDALGRGLPGSSAKAALPPPSDDGELWGMAYVLEGSRLGGKILQRRMANAANARLSAATSYLSHGAGSRHWQTFLAAFQAAEPNAGPCRDGAEMAFAAFHRAADAVIGPVVLDE